ncbi:MAG: FimV family protein [Burkholderiaceae bacterium]
MIVKIRNSIFGASLWAVALGASALSLGASRGSVVLGSPVDLSFDVEPDPGVELAASCISAALTAGSTPIDDARVRVSPLPDVRGRSPGVRVQASIALDEPVLTVVLSAGCSGRVSRTYTFLTDFPAAAPARVPVDIARLPGAMALGGSLTAAAPAVPANNQHSAMVAGRPADYASQPGSGGAAPRAAASTPVAARKPAASAATAAKPAPRLKARTPEPPKSRLVMEPLDVWIDTPLSLRSSGELNAAPSDTSTPEREHAQAAWKALNTPLEVLIDQDRRVAQLEAQAQTLKSRMATEQGQAQARQQALAAALEQRFAAEWVYGLAGVSALLAGLCGWLYSRQRRLLQAGAQGGWTQSVARTTMQGASEHELELSSSAPASVPASVEPWSNAHTLPVQPPVAGSSTAQSARVVVPEPPAMPASSATDATTAMPAIESAVAPRRSVAAEPASTVAPVVSQERVAGMPSVMHLLNAEDLFDIQQQAEFFISIGEHGHAVDILRGHIDNHGTSSPLAYIELLGLYHMLGRADDFNALRAEFSEHFNVLVPDFASFHRPGRGLEQYPDELAAIEAEWSTDAVLDRIEGYVSRAVGGRNAKLFDMVAFDDLLLLLAIAQTTPASSRGAPPPRRRTTPQAQSFEQAAAAAVAAVAPLDEADSARLPMDSLSAGIDFDFSEVSPPVVEKTNAEVPLAEESAFSLDLDLSDPALPHGLTPLSDSTATAAPPEPHQPVGFGSHNDLLEIRLELEPRPSDVSRKA